MEGEEKGRRRRIDGEGGASVVVSRRTVDFGWGDAGSSSGRLGVGGGQGEEALGARNRNWSGGGGRGAGDAPLLGSSWRKEKKRSGKQ